MASAPMFLILLMAMLTSAAKVGVFDTDLCVDPPGMKSCFDRAMAKSDECIKERCKRGDADRLKSCPDPRCVYPYFQDQVTCAVTHCWDQVYSCEYQNTAASLINIVRVAPLEDYPFFPPPRDAPSSCTCDIARMALSIRQALADSDTCGRKGDEILRSLKTKEEKDAFDDACNCCARSGVASSFHAVCPGYNLTALPFGYLYKSFTAEGNKTFLSSCSKLMDRFPCGSSGMDFTPLGGDKDAVFFKFDEVPLNGTKVPLNGPGTVTSPVSGATFTWTNRGRTMPVTVASPDATPTGNPGAASDNREDTAKDGDKDNAASRPFSQLGLMVFMLVMSSWL